MRAEAGVRGRARLAPALRVRLALRAWVQEVYPEATDATLMLRWSDGEFGGVDALLPADRVRWCGWPRAEQARERLRAIIREAYPDCVQADVVFYVGRRRSGLLPVPLDPPRLTPSLCP